MNTETVFDRYDRGELSRREALQAIALLLAPAAVAAQEEPTFQVTGLHHIALQVTDVGRSVDWYRRHLCLMPTSQSASSAFLDCGPHFLALFRSSTPGLAHYSYGLDRYSQSDAASRLRAQGIEPKLRGQRIYFDDPDGIEVQLS